MTADPQAPLTAGSWGVLLGRRHLGTVTLLAGAVGLYATNEFLTMSLLPDTVAEIGGQRLYAWVTTLYLVGSVAAATTVSAVVRRVGPRWAFLGGLAVFAVGSAICAIAPDMAVLLVGRTVQGTAGGLLAGLGYALINVALPRPLWTRASAVVSAMWGVATLVGPAIGGLFAQFGLWRWAFAAMVALTAAMAALVPLVLPAETVTGTVPRLRIPVWSLLLLGTAALAISVAEVPRTAAPTAALLGAAVVLVAVFVAVDRRQSAAVLPPSTFGAGPLKWVYLTMAALMCTAMVDMYVPLFGQRLAQLTPVAAGFLGATLAVGWTVSELLSASLRRRRTIVVAVAAAPLVMAVGLAMAAMTRATDAPAVLVAAWVVALLMAGTGIGMAWPHLAAWAMSVVADPAEGAVAAAAINTVQLIAAAFGAGLAGVIVNTADNHTAGGDLLAARAVFAMFAAVALIGVAASVRASRAAG
ncbi:MFS transporter [Mycolicibacillus parakoreensis]|uniref:MFS transporter n=1 Tax=Mycolicibacillus parakoreensis TaxID=1069221 RepID=A0ABY3U313_9MYCO|nr:MFS transporter [Mycolicibacillus parakoreensis]MCV7316711.1 MFS transporter [Mycolicibacillus parakoreensis]ULN54338.1 MFS transporter [Mycolicibacillus parakoreensis]HLR99653.1 MFS transporter [Mycolicibacillus parakoreensis]